MGFSMGALTLGTLLAASSVRLACSQGGTGEGGSGSPNVIYFEPPAMPRESSVVTSGNGCPAGSTDLVAPINTKNSTWSDWRLTFHRFAAADRPGNDTQKNANCQVHISISTGPAGWQVAVKALTVRSAAYLSPGSSLAATGTTAAFLSAGGDGDVIPRVTRTVNYTNNQLESVTGPLVVRFEFGDSGPWSSCMGGDAAGGLLNINFRVAVRRAAAAAAAAAVAAAQDSATFGAAVVDAATNSTTAATEEVLEWIWRRCTPPPAKTRTTRTATPAPPNRTAPPDEALSSLGQTADSPMTSTTASRTSTSPTGMRPTL